ncbi:MAG TPA: DUF4350 domain-containing protein [Candidatus Methylacidiphilales bacterium]|nr:DUF4350 domain-containing protein [Candidatus Methylacidiphilales bacterium]
MNRNLVYVRVLLAVLALVALLAFFARAPHHGPGETWLPSSFNPTGAGSMAFYQTLADLNWPVDRWRDPLSRLANFGSGNTLIITRSPVGARAYFTDQEIELLTEWMKRGNTLLLMGALTQSEDMRAMLRACGFRVSEPAHPVSDIFESLDFRAKPPIELEPFNPAADSGTLVLPQCAPLLFIGPAGEKVLWQGNDGPYATEAPVGAGHVICIASDRLFSNACLNRGDNLAIVLRLLAPGGAVPHHLFFEESHHGFPSTFPLARLLDHPGVRFAGMLALLGLLAFFGSSLLRFGPVVPIQPSPGRSALEFVDSIADLYQRADLRHDTLKYLFTETHQRVLHRLNLPPAASHELIASRLQQSNPHLPKWKKLAQRFDSQDHAHGLPPSGWLRVAKDLIAIKSAMA